MGRCLAWLLAAALVTTGAPALAQDEGASADTAREKFMQGQNAYQRGDYQQAIEAWQAAYELDPRPLILYNLSQAYERFGKLPQAVQTLEKYLAEADPRDPNRDTAQARLSSLQERLDKTSVQVVNAPEGAEIFVDGKSWGRAPRPDPISVDPGNHRVEVRLEGYENFRATVGVPAGDRVEVDATMDPAEAGGAPGAPADTGPGVGPYVLGGVGAGMVLAAAIAGGVALGKAKDADSRNSPEADDAESLALVADALGVVGGAAIGGAVIWWLVARGGDSAEEDPVTVSVDPFFGAGGGGAQATVRF